MIAAQITAGVLIGAGLFFLGLYVGLGVAEGREADRHARIQLARIQATATARQYGRPVSWMAGEAPPAEWRPAACYLPGYADPFPRAGRFALYPDEMQELAEASQLPHGPASRPVTSPVDLDGAVRLMCLEAEQYVTNLIASTYHAERKCTW